MQECSDEKLITDYLAGDERSLEILIRRYLKPIYSFIYRYVSNAEEAEDITQEVFLKIWRNLKKPALSLWFDKLTTVSLSNPSKGFDLKKGSFKTWVFQIAKNTCFDFLKKKKVIPFSEFENKKGENKLIETLVDPGPSPDELFERTNLGKILQTAMSRLAPKYRLVLFLRYNDHFIFREIAEILGESLNTIKSRHRRAITVLKKLLADKGR